ncbi:MAG TPA: NADH-quinone oxidoreductase subunit NuoE [Rhizomicrobium sp.]|jgi:NADH-quinone oxidoreductase subunit E
MSVRRLHHEQPSSFAFTWENQQWAEKEMKKYPAGRQASAVIALLWRGQEQEGWVSRPMIEAVARLLDMPYIRVLEVATFYTMFNLHPVGRHLVQVCTTTPCWLAGSDEIVAACKKQIAPEPNTISADGVFSWMEVECLGACVNAPMLQIGKDFYEDLDGVRTEAIFAAFRKGQRPSAGPQNGRRSSEPKGGALTLTDRSIYAGRKGQGTAKSGAAEKPAKAASGSATSKSPGAAS